MISAMSVSWQCHDSVMSCHVSLMTVSCRAVPCCVTSCHVMSRHVMSRHIMSRQVISSHVMPCHVTSRHATSCSVRSYNVIFYDQTLYMACHDMTPHVGHDMTRNGWLEILLHYMSNRDLTLHDIIIIKWYMGIHNFTSRYERYYIILHYVTYT